MLYVEFIAEERKGKAEFNGLDPWLEVLILSPYKVFEILIVVLTTPTSSLFSVLLLLSIPCIVQIIYMKWETISRQ